MASPSDQSLGNSGLYGKLTYFSVIKTLLQCLTSTPIRIGNGFAIGVSFVLKIAVGIAYIQYLWRTLRSMSISLGTINEAFNICGNAFSFCNWELLSRVRIGMILALILW